MEKRGAFLSWLFSAICLAGCASAATAVESVTVCEGSPPTQWYLTEIAPTLPPWQQHPDQLPPATEYSHRDQGLIELGRFDVYNDEALDCWVTAGDKVAAFALAMRIDASERLPYFAGVPPLESVLHYLRIAARDESPSKPCHEPFCHGVPHAMLILAYYRRIADDEQRALFERARDAGITWAVYGLQGLSGPPYTAH